ncbi:hypothetical protein [Alteromonas sp. OM2203]|uniref:hypothetical protein n=1 Tax=Alteromonas sp. OM2203 TaxID=3398817 RepID=UPI003AF3D404
MFKLVRKTVLLCSLIFVIPSSFAANTWHTSTIKSIYPVSNGDFIIIFNNSSICSDKNQYHRVTVGSNSVKIEGAEKMYSAALAAAAMGKTISINFDSSTSHCFINRLKVNY